LFLSGRTYPPQEHAIMSSLSTLVDELHASRCHTDSLFSLVRPDSFYERPIAERHRIVFYLGHLEAFDWNLIGRPGLGLESFHPDFDHLFAFGIDPDSGDLPRDQPEDWPELQEVWDYNQRVRETIDASVDRIPEPLLDVAIEHRWMHAETLASILHGLPYDRKLAPAGYGYPEAEPVAGAMVRVPRGEAWLGRERGDGFGWDNEFDEQCVEVEAFSIGRTKVTNGEYLAFVEAGGAVPHYWRFDGRWLFRGMFREYPLPPGAPVYVTHEQAIAYAQWRGLRLPTEAEFQRAAYAGEETAPIPALDNFDFRRWEPVAADSGSANRFGATQMIGNGWEWTSTVFGPLPGFEPFPFYPNYSEPFFDGRHYVLKGASPRTAARLTRPSFRNWFRPAYPYVYAGFRLAGN
jgi:gamma-glutamyl hercynylcysteine S-oxide synthase